MLLLEICFVSMLRFDSGSGLMLGNGKACKTTYIGVGRDRAATDVVSDCCVDPRKVLCRVTASQGVGHCMSERRATKEI